MKVGVPKEIKTHEYRVGLTPGAVREYVAAGHDVLVETHAAPALDRRMRTTARLAQQFWIPLARYLHRAR